MTQAHVLPDSEEIFQIIKRADINPHEIDDVGSHAVEVTVLWKSAVLHVAHVESTRPFVLTSTQPKKAPAGAALASGLGAGAGIVTAGAMTGSYAIGAIGTVIAVAGAGVGIALDQRNSATRRDASRFVVDEAMLGTTGDVPVVLQREGTTRVLFPSGANGTAEISGRKSTLAELIASGEARPSASVAGAHEIDVIGEGRYRVEIGALTIQARGVARAKKLAAGRRRDPATMWAAIGSAGAFVVALTAMFVASSGDDARIMNGNDEDRLAALRGFMQRQQDRVREQEREHPEQVTQPQQGPAGQRSAGAEGAAGSRIAQQRSARMAIARRTDTPQLSRQANREFVQQRGIFAALGPQPLGTASNAGPISPFGGMIASGNDERDANGHITGETIGDAFGYDGLGQVSSGIGGGGDGIGTVGLERIGGTVGASNGNSNYGGAVAHRLSARPTHGPLATPSPPTVVGTLPAEAIRRVVLRNISQVAHCQEQGLVQNPTLSGRVVVRFIIGEGGVVMGSAVDPSETNLSVPSVATCVANAVRRWQFPSPQGGTVSVRYPFSLQPAE